MTNVPVGMYQPGLPAAEGQFKERRRLSPRRKKVFAAAGFAISLTVFAWYMGWTSAPHRSLARSALQRRDPERAEAHLRWAQRLSPPLGDTEFLLARVRRKQGRLEEVRTHLQRAGALGFSAAVIRREEVLAMAQTGDLAPIISELSQLLQDPGDDGEEILEAYANGCLATQRYDLATMVLETWEKSFPKDPYPHYLRGRFFEHAERSRDAEEQYRAALARQSDFLRAVYRLGRVLLDGLRVDEAMLQFEQGTSSPHPAPFLLATAECLIRNGRRTEARHPLTNAAQFDGEALAAEFRMIGEPYEFDLAALELGRLELAEGNYEQALLWLERALKWNHHDLDALYSHAVALRALGRVDESQAEFKTVVESRQALEEVSTLTERIAARPDDVEARYRMGMLYLMYGSEATGVFWLKSALTYKPDDAATHQALAEHYEKASRKNPQLRPLAIRHRQMTANGRSK